MTDSCEQQEDEEEAITSGNDMRTVRKLIGETPDMQSIRDITEAVMEERRVEEIPPNTREQILRCCNGFYTLLRFSQITKEFEPDIFYQWYS